MQTNYLFKLAAKVEHSVATGICTQEEESKATRVDVTVPNVMSCVRLMEFRRGFDVIAPLK